ncbi:MULTISPECIES: AraC family transcriptional regulator [Bacillaceae]|uniref:AraC family transcriptional regulator n=1 Tax=Evansella alkalicola TaxID=745819 RepID=A0ABS6JV30_9BACI|nr:MULTISPECIES: AraC family transcriptional regulator [Bacillaceae]MBU9722343.1 AraC family transcriptional regulator [Bacillus alkalicola]
MFFFEHHGVDEKESFLFSHLTDYSFPLHFHRAYEFIYVIDGELSVSIDKNEYTLRKNDAAFIFPNQIHEFKTIDHSKITIVIFSPELVGHFYMNYKGVVPENNVFSMAAFPDLDLFNSIYKKKSFLYDLCSRLESSTPFVPVEKSTRMRVLYKILLYVDENYMNDCTLKTVAQSLQYDYAYLSKLFFQTTNMTFTDYLNRYRILQACYRLKNNQESIYEVALNCGYTNLRSFNRNFRRIMNQSPREYREVV